MGRMRRSSSLSIASLVPVLGLLALAGCSGSANDGGILGPSTSSSSSGSSSSGSSSGGTSGSSGATPREVPQSSFSGTSSGCSNVFAYRASTDKKQYLVVSVDRERLGLTIGDRKTVDLGAELPGVEVSVDVYASVPEGKTYCTDYRTTEPSKAHWTAQAGKLTIELTAEPEVNGVPKSTYRATLRLESVHLTGPEGGAAVVLPSATIEDVLVGWLPG